MIHNLPLVSNRSTLVWFRFSSPLAIPARQPFSYFALVGFQLRALKSDKQAWENCSKLSDPSTLWMPWTTSKPDSSNSIVPPWRVRHVAGHLLDTALRKLSMVRDGHFTEDPASNSPDDVRKSVDRLNAEGAMVYGRLGREALSSLMHAVSRQFCDWHRTLDPNAPAPRPSGSTPRGSLPSAVSIRSRCEWRLDGAR